MIPYPTWLGSGDNAWQMTAATLVGLMSIPALAVLYGGLVQKKWAMNTVLMVFVTFCLTLIVWVLWAYKMGFGTPLINVGTTGLVGDPRTILGANALQSQASIPLVDPAMPGYAVSKTGEILNSGFKLPGASVEYFQFVFAAITPILFIGSVLGRVSFKAWMVFVPLWITFAYAVNAFLLWGGGYWADKGALDFSGGYVIHLAAGVSGFVSAAVIGPRLKRDREKAIPNNLMFVAVGAGILWLGWNGFNGGDPYFAGADAGAAVVNTNLATAVAMMVWILMDMFLSSEKKPTFLGGLNGMICGLVGITPAAGFVNGLGAIIIGVVCSAVVWVAWMYPAEVRLAVQQGGRRARRHLHPRHRRPARRPARRRPGGPERARVHRLRQAAPRSPARAGSGATTRTRCSSSSSRRSRSSSGTAWSRSSSGCSSSTSSG